MKSRAYWIFIFAFLTMLFCACDNKIPTSQIDGQITGYEDWENTLENTISGFGEAYYSDGYLYYIYNDDIYEYDLLTDKAIKMNKNRLFFPSWLSKSENGILFTQNFGSAIKEIAFDDQEESVYYQASSNRLMNWYIEGDFLYGQTDGATNLFRVDMNTGDREFIAKGDVLAYDLDGDNIYYVGGIDQLEYCYLYIMKDGQEAQKIELEINPIMISAEGDRLVLADYNPYQLYEYTLSTGKCKKVDSMYANSYYFQLVGDYLYYSRYVNVAVTPSISMLRRYDFSSGEDILIWEEQADGNFCVFDEQTVLTRDEVGKPLLLQVIGDEVKVLRLPVW